MNVSSKQKLLLYVPLSVVAAHLHAAAPASEASEVQNIPIQVPPPQRIYREEVSAHPDDYLFDPANWERDKDTNEIIVSKDGVEKRRYEVPESCLNFAYDVGDLKTIDMLHYRFSRGLCAPTQWLDSAFGDPIEQKKNAGTTIRIVGSQLFQDDGKDSNDIRFKASVDLPYLENRLSLVVGSERDFEDSNAGLQGSPETTGSNTSSDSVGAALQWARERSNGWQFRIRAGFHGGLKARTKLRLRKESALNERWLWRFTEEISWRDRKGWGTETIVDFDRPIGPVRLFRATSRLEQSKELHKEGHGESWEQSFSVAAQINKRVAIRYITSVEGYTKPQHRVNAYRAGVRYRRNTWRPWFYYEVEPYLLWEREQRYNTTWGVVLRVETLYGKY